MKEVYKILYTKKSLYQLQKLEQEEARKIVDKLSFYIKQPQPLKHARKLTDPIFGEYRFRVGNYRIIFDLNKRKNIHILYILVIKHRKDIYKHL